MENAPKTIELVKNGMELGQVDDIIFKENNSKQKQGHFGLMTKGALPRNEAYRDGVISALVRFIQKDLF